MYILSKKAKNNIRNKKGDVYEENQKRKQKN